MNRLPHLDGLRGIAVLGVLAVHAEYLHGGGQGVTVFFVLSGFLITALLLAEFRTSARVSMRNFYIRRTARIFPLLVVAITALTIALTAMGRALPIGQWLITMTQLSNVVSAWGKPGYLAYYGWTWSLATEEQFYLVWPAVLVFLLHRGRIRAAATLATVVLVGSSIATQVALARGANSPALYSPVTRVDGLAAGCLIALAFRDREFRPRRSLAALAAAALAVCLWRTEFKYTEPIAVLASVGLVLHGAALPGLANAPLRYIGRISYGLYVWHAILKDTTEYHLRRPLHGWEIPLWLACSVAVASVSFFAFEQPISRWARQFQTHRARRDELHDETGPQAGSPTVEAKAT